jgi:3-isopropylmalate/(R)-2-methylmalate dehydratase small subunit
VSDDFLKTLFTAIEKNPATEVTVNLEKQTISIQGKDEHFDINPYKKACLMNGYDDIDYLISLNKEIRAFDLAHAN